MYYLESLTLTITLDSAKTGGAASSVTMNHLEGKTVEVVRDGIVEPTQTVPASPLQLRLQVSNIRLPGWTRIYSPGKDHANRASANSGSVQGVKKRIVQVDALLNETKDLVINGKQISFRNLWCWGFR